MSSASLNRSAGATRSKTPAGSDRHASAFQQTLDIAGAKDLMLNPAYKAMAWLGEAIEGEDGDQGRHCTDAIAEALYEHRKSLFGAISVAVFDTTSLYFAADGGATLGQRGHSKDFRPQLAQVVSPPLPAHTRDDGFALDPAKVEADAQFDGVFACAPAYRCRHWP